MVKVGGGSAGPKMMRINFQWGGGDVGGGGVGDAPDRISAIPDPAAAGEMAFVQRTDGGGDQCAARTGDRSEWEKGGGCG